MTAQRMTGIARLYTGSEMQDLAAHWRPTCELDHRILQAAVTTVDWVAQPGTRCCVCDALLNREAVYWVVLLPSDPEMGLGCSGGVCGSCGGLPRALLEAHVTQVATLMFEEAAGHG